MKCEKDSIILFGDSLTQRSFDPLLHGWGASLANIYARKLDVISHGFSGCNSEWCKHLLPDIIKAAKAKCEMAQTQVRLVVIFLGANDSVLPEKNPHQHVPLIQYKQNLDEMVDLIQRQLPTSRILLITPPPLLESEWEKYQIMTKRPMDRSLDSTRSYRDACISIAASLNVPVVDLWKTFFGHDSSFDTSLLVHDVFVDGVHLGKKGNTYVYNAILKAIQCHWPEIDPNTMKSRIAWWDKVDPSNLPASLYPTS